MIVRPADGKAASHIASDTTSHPLKESDQRVFWTYARPKYALATELPTRFNRENRLFSTESPRK